ncbi:MAG: GTP pyrophosphokinase family protein [Clostridia bacterium]|nr:GTP pyrophosphokinase family protein [Clostridia bacterium]
MKNPEKVLNGLISVMPDFEKEIRDLIESKTMPYMKLMAYYNCAMMEVETKFRVLDEDFSLENDRNPIESIKTRLKSPESILEKLTAKRLPMTVESIEENIRDIAGVRVICLFPDDVYMLADALLRQDDITLIEKKDYIKNPKDNGYRSLHLIVEVPIFLADETRRMKVEIQLRTIAMDCWATLEHQMIYKKDFSFTPEMTEELRRCAALASELDERMNLLNNNIPR